MNGAALQVNNSGNADAQAQELMRWRVLVGQKADRLGKLMDNLLAPAANFGERVDTLKLSTALLDRGDAQVGASQVNPDGECRHGPPPAKKQSRDVIITNRFNKTIEKAVIFCLDFIEHYSAINARIGYPGASSRLPL